MYVVFVKFLKVGHSVPHYPVYLLLGIVLWNFFGEITTGSVAAIVGKGDLLRKINFPRYVIILASSLSALINLALNFIVIVVFMIFAHIQFNLGMLMAIPLVIEIFSFALGIAFFLSALFVRFRDISYIWDVFMQGAFYGTPIFYALASVPLIAQYIIILNPVAQAMQAVRYVLITKKSVTVSEIYHAHPWFQLIPYLLVVLVAVVAMLYFKARSRHFAEEV